MERSRRARGLPIGYDARLIGRGHSRPPSEHGDESYLGSMTPMDPSQAPMGAFMEPSQHFRTAYRDPRLPLAYRNSLKEAPPNPMTSPARTYKILCITNINPKISDDAVKEALVSDFSRFGDISVSICHDSGERLAYIYFRSCEEARGARHARAKTLLFDRPIDIEPIYDPRESSVEPPCSPSMMPSTQQQQQQQQPPLQHYYATRRRSPTPPEYYLPDRRTMHPYPPMAAAGQRARSPPNYPVHLPRHLNGHQSPPMMSMLPERYYMHPMHMAPVSPYSSPPREMHEQYRSYPLPHFLPANYGPEHMYLPPYGPPPQPPPMIRESDKSMNESHMNRTPPHEAYYHMEARGYPPVQQPPASMHMSRSSSSSHSAGLNHQQPPHLLPNADQQSSTSSSSRRAVTDHPVRYMSREFRREKYGSENYSNESDEGRPSRVLFVNNIDSSKSEEDIRIVFSPFGKIDELELRQISADTSSALIKFSSMDCAYKAKTATNGKYIGKLKCRITYSRVSASRRLWIGGLGPNTTVSSLEDEFGRYGTVIDMDYTSGRPYAYVEFETANQAQCATHHLRGTLLEEAERRIRIEYVDPVDRNDKMKPELNTQPNNASSRSRLSSKMRGNERNSAEQHHTARKRSITPTDVNAKRFTLEPKIDQTTRAVSATAQTLRSRSNSPVENKSSSSDHELNNNQEVHERDGESISMSSNISTSENSIFISDIDVERIILAKNIREIISCCSVQWSSQLVLRNFNFPSKIHMCSGRKSTIGRYLNSCIEKNSDNWPVLRINQRWRLHPQPKLEEVKRRMQSANSGMLIITSRQGQSPILSSPSCKTPQSSSNQNAEQPESIVNSDQNTRSGGSESALTQSRPLKNLISYLEQKNAAGVISLSALDSDHSEDTKLLYAFPPGDFALNLLKRVSPNLLYESTKEEFLLGVIIGGGEAKI